MYLLDSYMIDINESYSTAINLHLKLVEQELQEYRNNIVAQIKKDLVDKVSRSPRVIIRLASNPSPIYLQAVNEVYEELLQRGYPITRDEVEINHQRITAPRFFIFELTQLSPQLEFNF